MIDIKKSVKGNAFFKYYREGNLYYEVTDGVFAVPISDLGNATLNDTEKGILLMRYMRKHNEALENAAN